jgi:hypothetical protein
MGLPSLFLSSTTPVKRGDSVPFNRLKSVKPYRRLQAAGNTEGKIRLTTNPRNDSEVETLWMDRKIP